MKTLKELHQVYDPMRAAMAKIPDDPEIERGQLRSQQEEDKRKAEAIKDFCFKCRRKDCDACCSFLEFIDGTGNPSPQTFRRFCHQCMTDQGLMVEYCQKYSCPVYGYSVKKSRAKI
jgi:hypothetical protein